ncbi:polysaccharide chain length determinant protein, PEP-CTERM locus subfamily [Pseudomonas frederiksbergensis]|uniref:Polysaccharide chain length determinant protein, PEP-CTERM locus subfamily n=1 Tax=Pseudomonas frederiksbergensis TaxID=104087 RepID=A0A1H5EX58_9PSED|nr:lipopolysaccharide biosynthesis protein [Pseudomonas frederiksbergensis]SED95716.1 polysaccharide chain length determinant protein, PEP-CTERM locus subfamily [Pseudomonas frederiksbergensis]
MATEYEMSFNDYLAIIKHHALLLIVSFVVILGVCVAVAISLPPTYESSGTILVESQQISPDLVAANNNTFADERIEVIRQRVMTREHLEGIINKYNLFASQSRQLTVTEKIEEMRNAIVVSLVSAAVKGRGEVTIAFRLSFEHRQPEIANKVAKELVTLFLDENIKQRTERASETTEFLTQEADKLRVELETLENRLADFKQAHSNALPEHQELRMNMLTRAETELKEIDRDYKTAREELRFNELELSAANAGLATRPGALGTAADKPQDLASLKAEYIRLQSLYTQAHPDVRAVKRKIAALQAGKGAGASASVNLDVARAQARISAAEARIKSLADQKQQILGKIAEYEAQIIETPQIERGLVTVMRDHDNARKKYEEIRTKEMSAKISESLEQENKAERFVLLESPLMPEKPVRPNRKKVVAMGFLLAPVGAGALVMLLEMMSQRVRGAQALASVLGRRVLVSIPYIHTKAELARRRKWRMLSIVCGVAILAIFLVLLHFLYMPLDLLIFKALGRFA